MVERAGQQPQDQYRHYSVLETEQTAYFSCKQLLHFVFTHSLLPILPLLYCFWSLNISQHSRDAGSAMGK